MAAIRSALMLGLRSSRSSGSTAAAPLGVTGVEKVFRPAARRTPPLPSLRPVGHSLESYRRFSTGDRVPADKTENWWQRRGRPRMLYAEDPKIGSWLGLIALL